MIIQRVLSLFNIVFKTKCCFVYTNIVESEINKRTVLLKINVLLKSYFKKYTECGENLGKVEAWQRGVKGRKTMWGGGGTPVICQQ